MAECKPDIEIAIIGTGFSGICMAIKLLEAGESSFALFEKSDRIGGTWRDNRYPGAACDIPSALYSFSFEQNPKWSHRYGRQSEILEYLEHCADKFGITSRIRFNQEIRSARYDAATGLWSIVTGNGGTLRARFLISGTGQLNRPKIPSLKGLENFKGDTFHSAQWNSRVDLQGKRIAVIGTAASAVQFVPQIAPGAAHLYSFQRTPNWIKSKKDRRISGFEKWIFEKVPFTMSLHRLWTYLSLEIMFKAFQEGSRLARLTRLALTADMKRRIKDPAFEKILLPDYTPGCKRILLSSEYLETLQLPNVSVIDGEISSVTEEGPVTADGKCYPADVIIFGTGFESTAFLSPIVIEGVGGRILSEVWREGAQAYRGILVSGFPNLFMLYGPNTNLGHNSIIYMIESQVHYILECLSGMKQKRLKSMDVRPEDQERYNGDLQQKLQNTVWQGGCSNWYKTEGGKIVNNWPGETWRYRKETRRVKWEDFHLEASGI